jgi:hypothetical protein
MSDLQPITDYVAAGQALLMAQYKSAPNVNGLLAVFLGHSQRLEDALQQLAGGRTLAGASGGTLDGIGKLVGIDRNGLGDDAYRVLIYAKVAENNGDATLQTLLRVTSALFATSSLFAKTPNTLARSGQRQGAWVSMMVGSPGIPSGLYSLVLRLVQQSLPAGVDLAHLGTFNAASAFAFAGSRPWVTGWGTVKNKTAGGPMASLLYSSKF